MVEAVNEETAWDNGYTDGEFDGAAGNPNQPWKYAPEEYPASFRYKDGYMSGWLHGSDRVMKLRQNMTEES